MPLLKKLSGDFLPTCLGKIYLYIHTPCTIWLQILVAVNKVLSLDVTEPLMKILSGMEYILKRAQVSACTVDRELISELLLREDKTPIAKGVSRQL